MSSITFLDVLILSHDSSARSILVFKLTLISRSTVRVSPSTISKLFSISKYCKEWQKGYKILRKNRLKSFFSLHNSNQKCVPQQFFPLSLPFLCLKCIFWNYHEAISISTFSIKNICLPLFSIKPHWNVRVGSLELWFALFLKQFLETTKKILIL